MISAHLPLVAVTALAAVITSAPVQQPTFSTSTRLVTVSVSVMKGGQPVTGLTRADFEVRSNNEIKPIVQFTNEPGPVTAALLLDASGSMDVNAASVPAEAAARDLLDALDPAIDRAGIFSFDGSLQMRHDFAPVGPSLRRALEGGRAFGSTSLYDAVLTTSQALAADGPSRRAVVVFTDGVDTSSVQPPMDVRASVAAIDVPVYVLAINTTTHGTAVPPGHPLAALAEGTGGQLFAVSPGVPAQRARITILANLRQHYLLAFEPDARPGWHSLTVRTRQNHTVRARAGYSVSNPSTSQPSTTRTS